MPSIRLLIFFIILSLSLLTVEDTESYWSICLELHKIFDSTPFLIRPLCNQYAPLAAPSLRLPETTWSTLILFYTHFKGYKCKWIIFLILLSFETCSANRISNFFIARVDKFEGTKVFSIKTKFLSSKNFLFKISI